MIGQKSAASLSSEQMSRHGIVGKGDKIAEGMYMRTDSTGGAEFTAGKMMTQQQASLHAPDSMGFDFSYADAEYEKAMDATGQGMLGYTGYEGKNYETDVYDIDDRLDDIKFLHGPFVERSPNGGWPMKHALLGEMNPTMASVIGTTTGYGAHYDKDVKDQTVNKYTKAQMPGSAKDQWAVPGVPESRSIGAFYKGPQKVVEPARRVPPPTRYQAYTPDPPKPDPPVNFEHRINRTGESKKHPDPAGSWGPGAPGESDDSVTSAMFFADGYSGHRFAHRYDEGEEDLSMASRIAKRRKESIERRFNESPDKKKLIGQGASMDKDGDGIDDKFGKYGYGWSSFPPKGLWRGNDTDLQAGQTNGPNNGQISSAKLYASNGN